VRDSRAEAVAIQMQLALIRASSRTLPDDLYFSIENEKEQVILHNRG
jgi:hypothetical protein